MNNHDDDDLRRRIFNVVPAATWQFEQLLGLMDIVIDESIPTAAVECQIRPRLLLNPQFVRKHCCTDEHLFMLIMHELYHVVLGHTRLFDRPTTAHNIAFDAVINAMLCTQFSAPIYSSFFDEINSVEDFPARLLRPPAGWPKQIRFAKDATDAERRVVALLYGPNLNGVTYLEIFRLLVEECSVPKSASFVLVGNHEKPSGKPNNSSLLKDIVVKIVGAWPRPPMNLGGRDEGATAQSWLMTQPADPHAPLRDAIRKLLQRAGVQRGESGTAWKMDLILRPRTVETVVPQASDRRAAAWRALYGTWPVIFHAQTVEVHKGLAQHPIAHVYLDISGSMNNALAVLGGSPAKPHREGLLRLFVFSTVVDEVKPRRLHTEKFRNTLGTNIHCVLSHLAVIPKGRRPRRVIILTDGFIGTPQSDLLAQLQSGGMRFLAGLTSLGSQNDLKLLNADITPLPT